jgi:spore coat protein CotH
MSSLPPLRRSLFLLALLLPFPLSATAEDTKDQDSIDLFDSQKLLEIEITLPEADWSALRAQSRSFGNSFLPTAPESPYTYFKGDISIDGHTLKSVGIRKKGFFGSMDQQRPSLKVKFNEYEDHGTVGGVDRLTLNNNKQDQSLASQRMAYDLFRKAGLVAPRTSLARVSVNGEYFGIYSNVESVKRQFLERNFGSSEGDLFEGTVPSDFAEGQTERFEIKQGKSRKDIEALATILANDGDDERLLKELEERIDVDQFLKYWALESLIGFWDGYAGNQNNYFLYQDPQSGKFQMIPWGADYAFTPQFQSGPLSVKAKGRLAYRLNQIPAMRQRYQNTLNQLLDEVWDEDELQKAINTVESLTKNDLHPIQQQTIGTTQQVRDFVAGRRKSILDEVAEGPIHVDTPPGGMSFTMKKSGELEGSFKTQWKETPEATVESTGTLTLTQGKEKIRLRDVIVTAQEGRAFGFGFGGPGQQGPPPVALMIQGLKEDDTPVRLNISIPTDQFVSDTQLKVQGFVSEGQQGFGGGFQTFTGDLDLQSAGTKAGSTISGSLTGTLYQNQGGGFGGRGGRGGFGRGGAGRGGFGQGGAGRGFGGAPGGRGGQPAPDGRGGPPLPGGRGNAPGKGNEDEGNQGEGNELI